MLCVLCCGCHCLQGKPWQFKEFPFKGADKGDMVDTFSNIFGAYFHYKGDAVGATARGPLYAWQCQPAALMCYTAVLASTYFKASCNQCGFWGLRSATDVLQSVSGWVAWREHEYCADVTPKNCYVQLLVLLG